MPKFAGVRELVYEDEDLREEGVDFLGTVNKSKYAQITNLRFVNCHITPKAVGTILMKLEKLKRLRIDYCTAHESVYREVPVVERKLEVLTITLDLGDEGRARGDYFDCHEIMLHPKLRLIAKSVDMMCKKGQTDNATKDLESALLNLEAERDKYLVSYLERYKDKISTVGSFNYGRRRIWRRLADLNALYDIRMMLPSYDGDTPLEEEEDSDYEAEWAPKRKKIKPPPTHTLDFIDGTGECVDLDYF